MLSIFRIERQNFGRQGTNIVYQFQRLAFNLKRDRIWRKFNFPIERSYTVQESSNVMLGQR